jgi:hypothetical protein
MNGTCKNTATLLKDQNCESWKLKKEKRCKVKAYKTFNKIIAENFLNIEK